MNRRTFLKALGATGVTATVAGQFVINRSTGEAGAPHAAGVVRKGETWVPTVCYQCPGGCGILARVVEGKAVKLEGNPQHPINERRLCPKGQSALQILYNPDRLQHPLRRAGARGEGRWQEITWEEAMAEVISRLKTIRDQGEPHTVAIMHGRLRGEMEGLIHRFLEAYGSPNDISSASLGRQTAKVAHLLTQGIEDLMAYDLENANYLLSFGGSLLEAGGPPMRVVGAYGQIRRGRPNRAKIVTVDPRFSITAAKSDEWVPIVPGTDAALALGLANAIIQMGAYDKDFVANYTFGFEDWTDEGGQKHKGFKTLVLEEYPAKKVSEITGVPVANISRLAAEFATNKPALAINPDRGALHASLGGSYTGAAIHSLNALVGNLDRPGGVMVQRYPLCVPWPDTQMDETARKGLRQPRIDGAGSKRFPLANSIYQTVARNSWEGNPYPLRALLLYYTNPVFSSPQGQEFVAAFQKMDFIVDFSPFFSDSNQYADLILPDHTFFERYENDLPPAGTGYPVVGLRQPVVEPLYNTRHTGDVLLQVAQGLGGGVAGSFPWKNFVEILQFRLSKLGVSWEELRKTGVWAKPLYPFTSPTDSRWHSVVGTDRRYAPKDGRFDFYMRELKGLFEKKGITEADLAGMNISARGDLVYLPHYEAPHRTGDATEYPLLLNTYKLMTHAEGKGGNVPGLQEMLGLHVGVKWQTWAEINPQTAHKLGIKEGDMVWVESPQGRIKVRAKLYAGARPDMVNIPFEQGHAAGGRWAQSRGANPNTIIPSVTEALAGSAAFTSFGVKVYRA
ncbi:MAG: molybdopterin-dependent oxidoreductase [Chloroflexi bacterium]|nr:molybdopterin-dependent oxidoreductase [Chloroflexota bacterium]